MIRGSTEYGSKTNFHQHIKIADNDQRSPDPISFKRLLQHFAAVTHQKKSKMTCFLKLFKRHQPIPEYDTLPSTGQQLLQIDGRDYYGFPSEKTRTNKWTSAYVVTSTARGVKRKRLPTRLPPSRFFREKSKYMHFGVESALSGSSVGLVFKNADLLQYITIYKENPQLLPRSLLKKYF